jgi:hypothetical protein
MATILMANYFMKWTGWETNVYTHFLNVKDLAAFISPVPSVLTQHLTMNARPRCANFFPSRKVIDFSETNV